MGMKLLLAFLGLTVVEDVAVARYLKTTGVIVGFNNLLGDIHDQGTPFLFQAPTPSGQVQVKSPRSTPAHAGS